MSYGETITRTDLKNILNEVLPSCSGMSIEDITDKITFGGAWTAMQAKAYLLGGRFVFFVLEGYAGTIVAGTQYTIATIASGYRPKDTLPFTGHATNSSYVPQSVVNCYVWTSGDITIRCSNANGNYVFISGWYALADGSAPITVADYIVEQGTSGNWGYIKWNSGRYEAWLNDSQSWAMTSLMGSGVGYYALKSFDISALGFTAIDNIQVTGNCAAFYISTKVETYSTSSVTLTAMSTGSRTDTVRHFIRIYGKWK